MSRSSARLRLSRVGIGKGAYSQKEPSHEIHPDDARPRGTGDWDIFHWTREARAAHEAYWQKLNADLRSSGALVRIEGLTPPAQARVVRSGEPSQPIVSDGPFPEAKEFSRWLLDHRRRKRRTSVQDCGARIRSSGPERSTALDADRGSRGHVLHDVRSRTHESKLCARRRGG